LSVRRLAKEQPASWDFAPVTLEKAHWWISKYPQSRKQSAVIPILWLIQKQDGWVCEPAIRKLAAMLEMPVIRVLEVVTFYTMFQLEPVGKAALIQVCGTTPCMLRGAGDLMKLCADKIGHKDHISADGLFTMTEVECIGACVNAPVLQVDDDFYEDMDAEKVKTLIAALREGKPPPAGSMTGRQTSAPEGGPNTLTTLQFAPET